MIEELEEKASDVIEEVVDLFDGNQTYTLKDIRNAAIVGLVLGSGLTGLISYLIGRYHKKEVVGTVEAIFEGDSDDGPELKLELDAEKLPELRKRWVNEESEEESDIKESIKNHPSNEVFERISGSVPTKPKSGEIIIEHKGTISPEEVSVIEEVMEGWDFDVEVGERKGKEVYILHRDEFWENENEYDQSTLTYYAGDDILCDEKDTPVYNQSTKVGDLRFGHGSGDPNVVYIRNVKDEEEYEILLDQGHYQIEVLGLEVEEPDDDSAHKGPSKFRPEE